VRNCNIQIPTYIHDAILEKNKKFWLSNFIFNRTFFDFILQMIKRVPIAENRDYKGARETNLQSSEVPLQFEIFRFFSTFFLTTIVRAKERKLLPDFLVPLREALKKDVSLCVWLLETFSQMDLIKELLIDCAVNDMKRFIAGLIKTAM